MPGYPASLCLFFRHLLVILTFAIASMVTVRLSQILETLLLSIHSLMACVVEKFARAEVAQLRKWPLKELGDVQWLLARGTRLREHSLLATAIIGWHAIVSLSIVLGAATLQSLCCDGGDL